MPLNKSKLNNGDTWSCRCGDPPVSKQRFGFKVSLAARHSAFRNVLFKRLAESRNASLFVCLELVTVVLFKPVAFVCCTPATDLKFGSVYL